MSEGASATQEASRALPHVAGAVVVGAATALLLLPTLWDPQVAAAVRLGTAAVVFLGCLLSHLRPLTLPWRGERMGIHPDEALLVAGVLYADGATSVLAATTAMLVSQLALRKSRLKLIFNTSVLLASSGVAVGIAVGLGHLLQHAYTGLLLVPIITTLSAQLAVATLLSRVTGRRGVLRSPQIIKSILVQSMVGIVLAGAAIATFDLHPLAPLTLVPVLWLCYRLLANEYRHETELEMRRVLSEVSARLVGETSEQKVVESALPVLQQCLDLRAAEFELTAAAGSRWTSSHTFGPLAGAVSIRAPILLADGARAGEMRLLVGGRGRRKQQEDQELATLLGAYLSMALGTVAALRAAREAEARLRQAFDFARDAIVVVADDGRAVYTNATARHALGVSEGCNVPSTLRTQVGSEAAAAILGLAPAADTAATVLATARSPTAAYHYEVSASQLTLGGGRPGLLLVARDVTRRLELEEEAERQRQMIARNERLSALGTLVAGVAHEVNSPLTYTRCNVEMAIADLELAKVDDGVALDIDLMIDQLKAVVVGVDRIGTITGALSVLARPRRADHSESILLDDLVRDLVPLVEAGLPSGVALEVRPSAADVQVSGVIAELQQATMNLVRNAIDAVAPAGGTVVIATGVAGAVPFIAVEDDGPGVQESQRSHLFNPFYTTKPDGTGLGLSMAQRIARAHGGDVVFTPREGRGARFSLRFAAAPPELRPLPKQDMGSDAVR